MKRIDLTTKKSEHIPQIVTELHGVQDQLISLRILIQGLQVAANKTWAKGKPMTQHDLNKGILSFRSKRREKKK